MSEIVMALEINSDKLNIKNILFTKALPTYTIPVETNGYKIFPCTECGDKFLFESSYNDHINRKSLKITYFCRHCNKIIINKNRCRLLSHIRSHDFKTTTINVSDLKIEPLPIEDINWTLPHPNSSQIEIQKRNKDRNSCYECKMNIDKSDNVNKDRAAHYMKYTNTVYTCPICLFSLPSVCALTAHLRIHLKVPPFFCPECGINLSRSISYPYNHYCEGFNMIRATTRSKCKQKNCLKIFHPNYYKVHIKSHLEKVYKCLTCSQVWTTIPTRKHFQCNNNDKIVTCFRCHLCPSKILFKNEVNKHLNFHTNVPKHFTDQNYEQVYPCMSCNLVCHEIPHLIDHHINKHACNNMKGILVKIFNDFRSVPKLGNQSGFYRVLKKCDKCLRSFLYRCEYENIKVLPNECPYNCSSYRNINEANKNPQIVCYLCKNIISENWDDIKHHFATFHKNHKCLDLKVKLTKIDNKTPSIHKQTDHLNGVRKNLNASLKKKILRKSEYHTQRKKEISLNTTIELEETPIDGYICNICNFNSQNKQSFESHIISHRDPCMAYQCLECGQCFVVKPSFSTHLLLEHAIADVNEYINKKQCYNESALLKQPNSTKSEDEPVKENQCNICREQFENDIDLEKHFRVHGMAFLMKTTNKNSSP